jgi:hypothetical protein
VELIFARALSANAAGLPVWSSLIGDLVPAGIRGRFFGRRNRATGMSTFGVFLRRFREVRPVEPIRHRDLIFRVSHIRPIAGATFSLFTGLFLEQEKKQGGKTQ